MNVSYVKSQNTTLGSSFGQPLDVLQPRTLRLAVQMRFQGDKDRLTRERGNAETWVSAFLHLCVLRFCITRNKKGDPRFRRGPLSFTGR